MKNAWLNLTSLLQVSPIEKKLWIILFWITPIELDTALTQKKGLARITSPGSVQSFFFLNLNLTKKFSSIFWTELESD